MKYNLLLMFQQFFSDGSRMGLDEFLDTCRVASRSIGTSQNPQNVTNAGLKLFKKKLKNVK